MQVWEHVFQDILHVDPSNSKIMLTDPPLNPTSNRQKMLEIMFERFGFQAAFVQIQAVLTLYAQGDTLNIIIDLICTLGEGT